MKYLKTYEELSTFELQKKIDDWLNQHNLNEIHLNEVYLNHFIKTELNEFKIWKIYDKRVYFINTSTNNLTSIKIYNLMNSKALRIILDYLNSLTEDEIIEIQSKQESEKFNF